ncbi:c-type cytochrome [Alkalihalobacillus sp. BA299]|uniref:c-type cytochrome n=1 Tax=Alkalihalobacillus sp. BA299 TaxID=2815938 RepID=UPI001ADA1297|nr:c-type cytochrome [Alkalihalobacillus sp. BA299]
MKSAILTYVLTFAIAFGGGYLFFQPQESTETSQQPTTDTEQESAEVADSTEEMPVAVDSKAGETLNNFGCLSCHAVSGLDLEGGTTGPDLSNAYLNVEGKHGKPLEEYLKEPTSAVMSGVIGSNPMSDEEIDAVISLLKAASENK